ARPRRPRLPDEFDAGIMLERAQLGALRLDGRGQSGCADGMGVVGQSYVPMETIMRWPIGKPATHSNGAYSIRECSACLRRKRQNSQIVDRLTSAGLLGLRRPP